MHPPACLHPLHLSLQMLLSSQGSKMKAELSSSNFWSDSWAGSECCPGSIFRAGWVPWSWGLDDGPPRNLVNFYCTGTCTWLKAPCGIPGLCPCLHCWPGGQAVRAQLLLLLSKRSCGIFDVLSATYKNIDTPDHYFFNSTFNNICIGDYPKPTKLHADEPGGGSSSLCCIQAFPLVSVFGDGLKWHPELDSLPPCSSRCAHKPKQTPLFQAHL